MQPYSLILALALSAIAAFGKPPPSSSISTPVSYVGVCGGSAAAAAGSSSFVVADDETSQLRVYRRDQPGAPLSVVDLTAQLGLNRHAAETDIEGAARIGDILYWVTSHGRSQSGKAQPNRCRFFATALTETNGIVTLSLVGQPYTQLLAALASSPDLQGLNLAAATRLPPKARGGCNIEGLCATPENELLLGFRNPIPNGKALLVPLRNPAELIAGRPPILGPPIQLDLQGLGIRDMAYADGNYLIIAGSYDGGGKSRLFRWAGGKTKPRQIKDVDLKGFNAEAMIIYPDKGLAEVQLLSDDSTQQDTPCRNMPPEARRFRSVWVSLGIKPDKKL